MTFPYLASTGAAAAAADLIDRFGIDAAREASNRAAYSRDLGNHLHFCRWREAGRLIDELSGAPGLGRRH